MAVVLSATPVGSAPKAGSVTEISTDSIGFICATVKSIAFAGDPVLLPLMVLACIWARLEFNTPLAAKAGAASLRIAVVADPLTTIEPVAAVGLANRAVPPAIPQSFSPPPTAAKQARLPIVTGSGETVRKPCAAPLTMN